MRKTALTFLLMLAAAPLWAAEAPVINANGQVGGLRLPTARHLAAGTGYVGIGYGTPYRHMYVGMQPIDALRITLRQQQDDRNADTYPGLDLQIQLTEEGEYIPAAALGYSHIIGQKRWGGEYLVLSKRFWNFDLSAGLGWGRYANRGVFKNPLASLSSRYEDSARDIGLGSTGAGAWYKGDRMGLFGSVTYQTPWKPLKLIAEFDRDPYLQENLVAPISHRAPVNVGAHYAFWDGAAVGLQFDGLSRGMLQLTYALNFQKDADIENHANKGRVMLPAPLPEAGEAKADLPLVDKLAWRQGSDLLTLDRRDDDTRIYLRYRAGDLPPHAGYLGHAAYSVAEQAEADIKTITLVPEYQGLTAGTYTIVRRDLLNASHFEGSPEEILQSTTVAPAGRADQPLRTELPGKAWTLFTGQRIDASPYEYGHFLLSREKLLFGGRYEWMNGLMLGGTIALESGSDVPPIAQTERKQVRSRLYDYTQQLGGIEQLYVNAMHSFGGGWHGRVTGGLLEEMYRGVSTEVLYQRLDARWAVGAEANWLQQRDPESEFGKTDYDTLTGNISFYYEVPPRDLTVIVRAEQFLARDQGVTLELQQQFQQGIRLGFVGTYSNRRDYGGPEDRGHSDARMVLSVPLQYSVQDVVINNGTQVRMGAIARDAGQSVEMPVRLWDATRPVSYGPLLRSWEDVLNW